MKRIAALFLLLLLLPLPGLGKAAGQPSGWDYVWAWQNDVAYVEKDGKIGLIHKDGRTLIEPRFDYVKPFENGIAAVYEGYIAKGQDIFGNMKPMPGKWGLLDQEGNVFVDPRWSKDPLGGNYYENNWLGYMDAYGRVLLDPIWNSVPNQIESMNDVQPVRRNDRVYFVDPDGNAQHVVEISSGYGVGVPWASGETFREVAVYISGAKTKAGAIDRKGNIVVPPEFDEVRPIITGKEIETKYSNSYGFSGGNLNESRALVRQGKKWGLWDIVNHQLVAKPEWDDAEPFNADLVFVKKGRKWGLINMNGDVIQKPQWLDVRNSDESENLAIVLVKEVKDIGPYTDVGLKNVHAAIGRNGEVLSDNFKKIWGLAFSNGLAEVWGFGENSDKKGYINQKGDLVIEMPANYRLGFFSGKVAVVEDMDSGLYGLINANGKWVLEPTWNYMTNFVDGYAIMMDRNLKYGLIDEDGRVVSPPLWDYIEEMREGFSCVYKGQYRFKYGSPIPSDRELLYGKYGYLNKTGEVIQPKWDSAGDFINGHAPVFAGIHEGNMFREPGYIPYGSIGKYGYINEQGQPVCGVKLQPSAGLGSNAYPIDDIVIKGNARWGVMSKEGETLIKAEWDEISALFERQVPDAGGGTRSSQMMNDRFVIVQNNIDASDYESFGAGVLSLSGETILEPVWLLIEFDPIMNNLLATDKKQKIGVYGLDGKQIAKPQWESLGGFSEGLAAVRVGMKYGFIDESYKTAIKPAWDIVSNFNEGYAVVGKNGKYGLINKNGKSMGKLQWEYLDDVSSGRSLFRQKDQYGYLGTDGKIAIAAEWDFATRFHDGTARVKKDSAWGFIDVNGALLGELAWERAFDFSQGLAAVRKGGKWGFIDKSGALAIEPEWDYVWPFTNGKARVELDGRFGYIDREGVLISGLK